MRTQHKGLQFLLFYTWIPHLAKNATLDKSLHFHNLDTRCNLDYQNSPHCKLLFTPEFDFGNKLQNLTN